ncbi:outer membrane protein assembly factor BamB family protein [Sunxiuqinia sp. A32]|uniref:outer membrane protein assembly factor BamB family protein n=1 Tax=Sunxiuqinia sp. A32 TaxID=3461496 RepID=UPI0040452671
MKQNLLLLALLLFAGCQQKPQLTEWRGPNRSGIYNETNLLKSWPEKGPDLIWEKETVGNGYSSPIVTDEFIYITGEIDSLGCLFKFDLSGNKVWQSEYGKEWTTNFQGSRGTPTLYGDQIYICSGVGDIACIQSSTGKLIWKKNMINDFEGVSPRFGYAQALAIDDNKIFCLPGGEQFNIVALDRMTGELIWSNEGFKERPGYNPSQIIKLADEKLLVTFSAYHLMGIDTETGKIIWSHEQTNIKPDERGPGKGDTHGNTIIYEDGYLYYAAGDGNCGVKLKLSQDGKAIEEEWTNKSFDCYMGGIVKIDSKLYGSGTQKPYLKCIDCQSWEVSDSLKIGNGALISADNMLYYYNFKGEVYLIDPSEDAMKPVSSFKIEKGTKEHFSHPVINGGVLYIRHGNYLGAYDIKNNS